MKDGIPLKGTGVRKASRHSRGALQDGKNLKDVVGQRRRWKGRREKRYFRRREKPPEKESGG